MALFAGSGPLFYMTLYVVLIESFIVNQPPLNVWWLVGASGFLLLYGLFFLNINFSSPHRFYRNRLSDAFLIRPALQKPGIIRRDAQKLSALRSHQASVPYHLINAAINVTTSKNPNLRGRTADFFLFSQKYCGSPISGYYPTEDFERLDPHLDLGTAMAISGAAAAPYMGQMTIRQASFFLTALNVRLGYWLRNPAWNGSICPCLNLFACPNVWYLFRELVGWLKEEQPLS